MIKKVINLGDTALYCDFGQEVNKEVNSKVIKYFYSIKKNNTSKSQLRIYDFKLKSIKLIDEGGSNQASEDKIEE